MSRVDYFTIEEAIKSILDADAIVSAKAILIEEELVFERGNIIGIYLDDRQAPDELQSISAGTRTRFLVSFSLWCWHFGVGRDRRVPMEQRDDLLGNVEIALMKVRNLNDTVNTSWLLGGEFLSGPDPTGKQFMSGAQIILVADVTAST